MSAKYNYETNEVGFHELLLRPALASAMVTIATPAVAEAAKTAPRRTGAYASGFTVHPEYIPAGRKGEIRAGAVVENDVPYARYVMDDYNFRSHMWNIGQRLGGVTE